MRMKKSAELISILMILVSGRLLQKTQPIESIQIPLNTPYKFTQQASTYNYYTTSVQQPHSDYVLLITLTADIQTRVSIFVSTSNSPTFKNDTWPNYNQYTQECQYSSIDTCAIHMPNVDELMNGEKVLVVHFTVYVSSLCVYVLDVSLETIYQIKVNQSYTVNLENIQSAMTELSAESFLTSSGGKVDQIVVTCTYTSYRNLGHFQLLAAEGDFPNPSQYNTIVSKSLNGFTQILELKPLDNLNSSYFILIQGQNNTKINFTVKAIESLANPQLVMNDTVSYLIKSSINYTYHSTFPINPLTSSLLPFHIDLYAYRGYGQFIVDYCNGLYNFTFQNAGGEQGQIIIDSEMRYQCYQQISKTGGLLLQNLLVAIRQVYYQFGYAIGLYEDAFDIYLLPSQRQIGVLSGINDSAIYKIDSLNIDVNFSLTIQVIKGSINVVVEKCVIVVNVCSQVVKKVLMEPTAAIAKIGYTCPGLFNCHVIITQAQGSNYSKYSLINEYANKENTQLLASKPITDIILMNEYKFYFVNVSALRMNQQTKFTNATIINIRKTEINGDSIMLTSTNTKQPTFEDLFEEDSDVQYNSDGAALYVVNLSYPNYIYIGILGDSQCIYHIQFVLNISANIPAAYLDMVEDGRNDYTLTLTSPYILLKYVSHIVPYSITFSPSPSCIKYSNKLPVSNGCASSTQLLNVFHERVVYFNISQPLSVQGAVYKFSAYVNSGSYYLTEGKPILIACERACYQLISVVINVPSANILHKGYGSIAVLNQSSMNNVSNGQITLKCSSAQCSFQLNASMVYGGNMEISFQSNKASEVEWRTKPMSLPTQNTNKYFYMRISKYSDFSSLIFYTSAADLSIYYNIISLDDTFTNTINYQYPTITKYQQVSYGDPLQEIHIVDINPQYIEEMKCKENNIICVVTFMVVLNKSVEYSLEYINGGLGYYSSNTYQYEISPNWPIFYLKQQYSISYFSHEIDYLQQATNYPYTISIKPISNCRPAIQIQQTSYLRNYYTNIKLQPLLLDQRRINYRVLSNEICMFHTAVTTSPYAMVFANVMHEVEGVGSNATFTYQHRFFSALTFTVRVSQTVSAIIVNKLTFINNTGKPQIVLPAIEQGYNVAYTTNSSSLTVSSVTSGQYLLTLKFPNNQQNKSHSRTLIIQLKNQAITLLHNQQHSYIYDPTDKSGGSNQVVLYEYHSTNQFYVFVSVSRMKVRVRIRDADSYQGNQEFANVVISNVSQPWIFVNSSNTNLSTQKLINYLITCQFLNQSSTDSSNATLKLHIQQDGILGLTQIYLGVSTYDAFVHNNGMNCYKFITSNKLQQPITNFMIDLNFIQKQESSNLSEVILGMASIVGITNKLDIKQFQISENVYRMILNYYNATIYKLCYVLKSAQLVGAEYSIIINVPSMPMIYSTLSPNYSSTIYSGSYNMFQYINYNAQKNGSIDNQSVVMTVTNCVGISTVLATPSYSDMQTGKMTEVLSEWNGNGVTVALINIPHGYYYFGIKSANNKIVKQTFRVNVKPISIIGGKNVILQSMYYINFSIQSKTNLVKRENKQFINIQVPSVLKIQSADQNYIPNKIIYYLYLITQNNQSNKQNNYSLDSYTRCPQLFTQNTNYSLSPISIIILQKSSSSLQTMVSFDIDTKYQQSNYSVKAEVYLTDDNDHNNMIQYYYGSNKIKIKVINQNISIIEKLKWLISMGMVLAFFGCVGYFCNKRRKKKKNIKFEVDDTMGREMSTRTPQMSTSQKNTSSNKPINTNIGYGQFVDQVSA